MSTLDEVRPAPPKRPVARAGSRLRAPVLGIAGLLLGALLWDLVNRIGFTSGVPGPWEVVRALVAEMVGPELWSASAHTLLVTVAALAIATVVGTLVGAAVGVSPLVGRLLSSSIDTLRFVPPVALIPVVLLVLGFGVASELAVAVFAAVWPILLGVATAAAQLGRRYHDVVRVARLGPAQQLRVIFVPGSFPAIVTGARVGSALALILVIAMEMLAVPAGLGHQVRFAGDALALPTMYAYIVWTGLLGVLLDTLTRTAERRMLRRPKDPS